MVIAFLRNRRRHLGRFAALMLVGAGACGEPTAPGAGVGQIIFTSSREGVMRNSQPLVNIFRMAADGSGVENLTDLPGWYHHLAPHPDGRTIIFEATPDYDASVAYLSPDGSRIAYLRAMSGVVVIDTDGTTARTIRRRPRFRVAPRSMAPYGRPPGRSCTTTHRMGSTSPASMARPPAGLRIPGRCFGAESAPGRPMAAGSRSIFSPTPGSTSR